MFWTKKSPEGTVKRFIEAMNGRDFALVEELLADDFRLTDSAGCVLQGREACLALFVRLTELIPDYEVRASSVVQRGEDILVSGESHTEDPDMRNSTQWRARADKSRMLEWQSYEYGQSVSMIAEVEKSLQ